MSTQYIRTTLTDYLQGGQGEGQRLTKVDRSDDIVKVITVGREVGEAIKNRRQELNPPLKRDQLATKVNLKPTDLETYENGTAKPDQKVLAALEKVLGVKLRGNNIGEPRFPKKS